MLLKATWEIIYEPNPELYKDEMYTVENCIKLDKQDERGLFACLISEKNSERKSYSFTLEEVKDNAS